jgi:hypothetical protein
MSLKQCLKLSSLLLLALLATQVWAQTDELTQQVPLSEGFAISVPDDWEVQEDEEDQGLAI